MIFGEVGSGTAAVLSEEISMGPVLEAYGWGGGSRGYGKWRSLPCPFHGDRHPSASMSETGFICHSCGIKGNAVTLVAKVEGISNAQAREWIGRLGSSPLPPKRSPTPSWLPASRNSTTLTGRSIGQMRLQV